uniref:Uncharacterized protein n=1 Tax=Manihot esculenta TaxID=3983 RepID=A0A2C9VA30_MANES
MKRIIGQLCSEINYKIIPSYNNVLKLQTAQRRRSDPSSILILQLVSIILNSSLILGKEKKT